MKLERKKEKKRKKRGERVASFVVDCTIYNKIGIFGSYIADWM